MPIILDGTAGIDNNATDLSYTGTLTGGTGVVNLGSGQLFKDASGNVGIGTGSPVGKLNVIGGLGLGAALTGDQAVTPPSGSLVLSGSNQSSEQTYTSPGGATTLGQVYNYASSGNSFFRYLDIVAYGSTTGAGSNIRFITGNGTTNTERARIDSSGNLLVGTTDSGSGATAAKQRIIGSNANNLYLGSTTAGGWRITSDALSDGGTFFHIKFVENGTQRGSITSNGSSTSYTTTSDYRLKENIAPMTGALAKVAALKPCTYKWKVDGSAGQGFIAHELAEVEAGCVTGEKDAVDAEGNPQYQGIDTSFLVATLAAAIQEQQAIIESLTARVVALEQA